jgi:hypothetical protein
MDEHSNGIVIAPEQAARLATLAQRYLWWQRPDGVSHAPVRMIAQIMHLGTYDDIRQLEALVGEVALADTMRRSQPGWFDDRSWSFWRGRLEADGQSNIPTHRPQRAFMHADPV